MYRRSGRGRVLLLVFVALCIVLITLDFRQGEGGPLERARDISAAVVAPIQRGFATVFRPVADFFSSIAELGDLREENRTLELEVREFREQQQRAQAAIEENQELRETLGLVPSYAGMESIAAEVIAVEPANYQWAVSIDKGTEDGIQEDMAVVAPEGLVGKVVRATSSDAIVLYLIDPRGAARAKIVKGGPLGIIEGNGSGEALSLTNVDSEAKVDVGDEVVTSAYNQGIFPSNIKIGSIESVSGDTAAPQQNIDVEPYVDFQTLEIVIVLLDSGPRLSQSGSQ
jgi:rod shape-determining protein MreC